VERTIEQTLKSMLEFWERALGGAN